MKVTKYHYWLWFTLGIICLGLSLWTMHKLEEHWIALLFVGTALFSALVMLLGLNGILTEVRNR
jgi:hypothetical protein